MALMNRLLNVGLGRRRLGILQTGDCSIQPTFLKDRERNERSNRIYWYSINSKTVTK